MAVAIRRGSTVEVLSRSEYGWGKCFVHEGGIRIPAIVTLARENQTVYPERSYLRISWM